MKLIIIQSYLPRILFLTILVNSNSTVNASLRWPTWNKKKQPGTTKEQLKPESPHSASPPPTATSSAPESEHPTKLANDKVDSHSNLNPSDVRPASLDLSQKPTGSSSTNATSSISVSEHPELAEPESPRSSTPRPAAANSASESEHPTKLANDKVDNHPNLKPSKVRPASLDLSHKNAASQPPEKRSSGELSLPQPNKLIAQTLALDPVRLPSKQRPSSVDIGLLSRQKPAEHLSSSPTPSTTKLKPLALEPEIQRTSVFQGSHYFIKVDPSKSRTLQSIYTTDLNGGTSVALYFLCNNNQQYAGLTHYLNEHIDQHYAGIRQLSNPPKSWDFDNSTVIKAVALILSSKGWKRASMGHWETQAATINPFEAVIQESLPAQTQMTIEQLYYTNQDQTELTDTVAGWTLHREFEVVLDPNNPAESFYHSKISKDPVFFNPSVSEDIT